jgi:short-subunit dehydrogenase
MPSDLVAVITGGSRGIGAATAAELAPLCSKILLVGRDKDALEQVRSSIASATCAVKYLSYDMRAKDAVAVVSQWVKQETARVDVLFLNAAYYVTTSILDTPIDVMRDNIEAHLIFNQYLAIALYPLVKRSVRRRIVITGSLAAYVPYTAIPTYGVQKWALRSLAQNMRKEFAKDDVGVIFIAPGSTRTDMYKGEGLPQDRLLEPKDVARMVRAALELSQQAVVNEIIVEPMLGYPGAEGPDAGSRTLLQALRDRLGLTR